MWLAASLYFPCGVTQLRGWSEKFSASNIDGNTMGKIFFLR
jgi:hypothetical protein